MSDATESIYRSWAAGRCPCCGGPLIEWEWQGEVTQPAAIGECVQMCGRCIANDHAASADGFVAALLESILTRSDTPIDRLMERIGR